MMGQSVSDSKEETGLIKKISECIKKRNALGPTAIKLCIDDLLEIYDALKKQIPKIPYDRFNYNVPSKNFECSQCKTEIFLGDNYCSNCGHPIDWDKYDEESEAIKKFKEYCKALYKAFEEIDTEFKRSK